LRGLRTFLFLKRERGDCASFGGALKPQGSVGGKRQKRLKRGKKKSWKKQSATGRRKTVGQIHLPVSTQKCLKGFAKKPGTGTRKKKRNFQGERKKKKKWKR